MMTSKRISLGRRTLAYALMILSAAALFLAIGHFGGSHVAPDAETTPAPSRVLMAVVTTMSTTPNPRCAATAAYGNTVTLVICMLAPSVAVIVDMAALRPVIDTDND